MTTQVIRQTGTYIYDPKNNILWWLSMYILNIINVGNYNSKKRKIYYIYFLNKSNYKKLRMLYFINTTKLWPIYNKCTLTYISNMRLKTCFPKIYWVQLQIKYIYYFCQENPTNTWNFYNPSTDRNNLKNRPISGGF